MLYVISYKNYLESLTVTETADADAANTMLTHLPSGYSGGSVDPAHISAMPLKTMADIINLGAAADAVKKFKTKAEAFTALLDYLKTAPKSVPPQVDASAAEGAVAGKKPLTAAQLKRIEELAEKKAKRDAAKAEREANKTRTDEEKAAAKAAKDAARKAAADAKKAAAKAAKPPRVAKSMVLGDAKSMRAGTSLGNLLTEAVKGTQTLEQIAASTGLPVGNARHRLCYVLPTRNGVKVTVDKDTKIVSAVLPKGETLESMVTTKAVPQPAAAAAE